MHSEIRSDSIVLILEELNQHIQKNNESRLFRLLQFAKNSFLFLFVMGR